MAPGERLALLPVASGIRLAYEGACAPDEPHVKNRRLLRRFRELEQLPSDDQQALLRTIDAFLAKAS